MTILTKASTTTAGSGQNRSVKYAVDQRVHLAMANASTEFLATITKVDQFGQTPHYGFLLEIRETFKPSKYESGWMPCSVFDAIAIPTLSESEKRTRDFVASANVQITEERNQKGVGQ